MRSSFALVLFACGADEFVAAGGVDAGAPDARDAAIDAGFCAGHALCDDFDKPNQIPGTAPWTRAIGTLAIGEGYRGTRGLEAKAEWPGNYATWALPSAMTNIDCTGRVFVTPSKGARTILTLETDVLTDGGQQTAHAGVNVSDTSGVSGVAFGAGLFGSWGMPTSPIAASVWHPVKFSASRSGSELVLSANVGGAAISGMLRLPPTINARINFGAGAAASTTDLVRWDDIICDVK